MLGRGYTPETRNSNSSHMAMKNIHISGKINNQSAETTKGTLFRMRQSLPAFIYSIELIKTLRYFILTSKIKYFQWWENILKPWLRN
jgi:hypothetical protein